MSRSHVAAAMAFVFAIGAVALAWRALGSRRVASPQPTPPSPAETRPFGVFSLVVRPEFETQVTATTVQTVARSVRERAAEAARTNPDIASLGPAAIEALLAGVQEQSEIYLGGSWERHWAFLQRTRAGYAMLDAAAPEAKPKLIQDLASFWRETCQGVALHPVSLEEVTLRPRFVGGRETRQTDDNFAMTKAVAPERWPLLAGDPAQNKLTIVELMTPIFYARPPEAQAVYMGVWFVWDAAAGDWKIHQLRMYSPVGQGGIISPSY